MEFEKIDKYRARAKVCGGWIVETILYGETAQDNHEPIAIASCFVPDPKHKWELLKTYGKSVVTTHMDTLSINRVMDSFDSVKDKITINSEK